MPERPSTAPADIDASDVLWFVGAIAFYAVAAIPAAWAVDAIFEGAEADYLPTFVLLLVVAAVTRISPFSWRERVERG